MSEVTFTCANCGKAITEDASYGGSQIPCPQCGKLATVPFAPPAAAPAPQPESAPPTEGRTRLRLAAPSTAATGATPAAQAPAPPGEARTSLRISAHEAAPERSAPTRFAARPAAPPRTSRLAVASLICSIGSFICIPLGFLPGILCGHLARSRIRQNPFLQGDGLAKAGLIVGYLSLGVHVAVIALLVSALVFMAGQIPGLNVRLPWPGARDTPSPSAPVQPPDVPADLLPDGTGWTLEVAAAEIPGTPVEGRIREAAFAAEEVFLRNGCLNFRQGQEFLADQEMRVVLFESDPEKLAGRKFLVLPGAPITPGSPRPHVWMGWREGATRASAQRTFVDDYAMRLEFGELRDGKLSGRVYLCVPDAKKSYIRGTFECEVRPAGN